MKSHIPHIWLPYDFSVSTEEYIEPSPRYYLKPATSSGPIMYVDHLLYCNLYVQ